MSEEHIHRHYTPTNLYDRILDGLAKLDREPSEITIDDLAPVDEFHIRGDEATRELIDLSGFTQDMHILEVGCGIGGADRLPDLKQEQTAADSRPYPFTPIGRTG